MQMNNRRPIVAGNWKMNGNLALIKQVEDTFSKADVSHVDVVVCPPFPYLGGFNDSNFALGGQNISQFESGAHTGETAVGML